LGTLPFPQGEVLFCNTERIPEFKKAVLDLVNVERNEAAASVVALEEIMEALTSDRWVVARLGLG
jgi:hypothetical protein